MPTKTSSERVYAKQISATFDKLIHDQSKRLIKNFSERADEYPVNTAMLMHNIVWQLGERIINKQNHPLQNSLVYMATDLNVMRYKDIGFCDDKQGQRMAGER